MGLLQVKIPGIIKRPDLWGISLMDQEFKLETDLVGFRTPNGKEGVDNYIILEIKGWI